MSQPPSNIGDDLGIGLRLPGGTPQDAGGRRRLHPVTPLAHAVIALPIGFVLLLGFSGAILASGSVWVILAGAVACFLVLPAVVALFSYLSWRNLTYWFDDDGDFRVDSGVLTRKQRRLQLSRLQSVDVNQPLLARILGLAEVVVEVAGAGESRVKLQFLQLEEARALRSEILARAAGLRHDAGEAAEEAIAKVTPRDLVVSLLVRTSTAALLGLTVLILVIMFVTGGWAGLLFALVTGGVPILIVVAEFINYFGFTVSRSPDGLRLHYGLAKTQARTVPPGRVQAIEFVEPLLWRRWTWVRVRVNIAGTGHQSNGQREETLLIPVATREVAHDVVEQVLPGLVFDALDWRHAPERSRWRSPIQWRRLAVAWDDGVLVARRGRVTRRTMVIPHARTQSVRLVQGPWERRLRLASVHVDSTPGPVKVMALRLDEDEAAAVARGQCERAERARASDASIRWANPPSRPTDPS